MSELTRRTMLSGAAAAAAIAPLAAPWASFAGRSDIPITAVPISKFARLAVSAAAARWVIFAPRASRCIRAVAK